MEAGSRQPERPIDRATVAAVIPAYFEEAHVREVVKRTRRQLDHVLVVDDGSGDATAARAREGGAEPDGNARLRMAVDRAREAAPCDPHQSAHRSRLRDAETRIAGRR